MIPYSILMCRLTAHDNTVLELRILDLSPEGFTFRLSHADALLLADSPRQITLYYYRRSSACYQQVSLTDFTLELLPQPAHGLWQEYRLQTGDADFRSETLQLSREYTQYIRLKLEEDDASLSSELTLWPSRQENIFAESLTDQYHAWFRELRPDADWLKTAEAVPERALSLSRRDQYEDFLQKPFEVFLQEYWSFAGLAQHPVAQLQMNMLYIGNAFCALQFPDHTTLKALLEKCHMVGLRPVLVFSPVPEQLLTTLPQTLELLAYCGSPELVINDWGMLALLQQPCYQHFRLTLGPLLLKTRKDPRLKYSLCAEALLEQLHLFPSDRGMLLSALTEDMNISRISVESCGYPLTPASLPTDLQLPLYQTNTAACCTLTSAVETGSRGRPAHRAHCPGYCAQQVFLYPRPAEIIGIGNALFGRDLRILEDSSYLCYMLNKPAPRLVFNLM